MLRSLQMAWGPSTWWKRIRSAAAIGLVFVFSACASPTLPLPPPALPSMTAAGDGKVTLRSEHGVEANAIVVIYNHNTTIPRNLRVEAAQADAEGTWEETVVAYPGDIVDVTQEFGTTHSAPTTFRIPTPTQ
jgi:hypothetical protein